MIPLKLHKTFNMQVNKKKGKLAEILIKIRRKRNENYLPTEF